MAEDASTLAVAKRSRPSNDTVSNLGLTVQARTRELMKEYGLEKEKLEGVLVTEVVSGSEADRKKIRPGAIITEVNQKRVTTPKQFLEALKAGSSGKGIRLTFTQEGTSRIEILKDSGD
jgi:serine protease Do